MAFLLAAGQCHHGAHAQPGPQAPLSAAALSRAQVWPRGGHAEPEGGREPACHATAAFEVFKKLAVEMQPNVLLEYRGPAEPAASREQQAGRQRPPPEGREK